MQKRSTPLGIGHIQRTIEDIYCLDTFHPVELYLVSGNELQEYLPKDAEPRPQVLLHEKDDEVRLAVHLGDEVMERVETLGVDQLDLSDLCSVVEEISHFLYLTWSAINERPVSLLDVELQGEIDKFLLASRYYPDKQDLLENMFENFVLHANLETNERNRYQEANRLGEKFCRSLGQIFNLEETDPEILGRLRTFWRLATQQRLAEITKLK